MKKYILYQAECSITGKKYIGYTNSNKTFERRKYEHYNNAFSGHKTKFYNAIRKHPDNFVWTVLEEVDTHEQAKKREIELISEFNTYREGYNSTKGGDGGDLSEHRTYKTKEISKEEENDIIQMYVDGVGKAEICRKYPNHSITFITSLLRRNGIEELPPINQRNKKDYKSKQKRVKTEGEKNHKYVHIENDTKMEMANLYITRKMTKREICKKFSIGYKLLSRVFNELNIEKNKPQSALYFRTKKC